MSIAQRYIASEGEARPAGDAPELTCSPDAHSSAFGTDVTNLKWLTLRAEHRAHHVSGISNRARAVLAALARTVDNARPTDKIFAGRGLLQERAMVPERTFFRALTDLSDAGLIVRHKQWDVPGRAGWNRAYLALTDVAVALLGLNERSQRQTSDPRQDAAANDDDGKILSFESAKVAGPIKRDLYPTSQKRQPGQLPEDLQRLRDLGFHEFLIFKLMREAKEQGKRLSDVTNVAWKNIQAAAKPICYVRALLRSSTDFCGLSRYAQQSQTAVRLRVDAQVRVATVIARAAGKVFYDTAATRRIHVSVDGQTARVQSLQEPIERVAAGAWHVGFVDALMSGRWVNATPTLDAAFSAAVARDYAPTRVIPQGGSREAIAALRTMFKGPRAFPTSVLAA